MRLELFVACAPGLERWLVDDVRRALGPRKACEVCAGGVTLKGDEAAVMRLNLALGVASSVRVRVGQLRATRFDELVRKVERLPLERFLVAGAPLRVRASCQRSRLYHSDAVAERVRRGVEAHLGQTSPTSPPEGTGEHVPALHARFVDDVCVLSLDTSGEPLHRRGYRLETARAPLREDLAHALVRASGWSAAAPLVDPFSGAGTVVIEAARIARRIPPGRDRGFAFMGTPLFDPEVFADVRSKLDARVLGELPFELVGSDRDGGAVEAAQRNAERAGVGADVRFVRASLSEVPEGWPPLGADGAVVANMPFGQRVSRGRSLVALHQRLGRLVAEREPDAHVAVLVADKKLAYRTGLGLSSAFHTRHGGLGVHAMVRGRA